MRLGPYRDKHKRWDMNLDPDRWKGGTLILAPWRWGPFAYHPHEWGLGTLMRITVKLPFGRKVMLHHFQPHRELEWHDHPWDFTTIVLWGGYTDESLGDWTVGEIRTDHLRMGSVRRRRATHAHRTCSEKGALTLVFTSEKKRDWCHSGGDDQRDRSIWTCQS